MRYIYHTSLGIGYLQMKHISEPSRTARRVQSRYRRGSKLRGWKTKATVNYEHLNQIVYPNNPLSVSKPNERDRVNPFTKYRCFSQSLSSQVILRRMASDIKWRWSMDNYCIFRWNPHIGMIRRFVGAVGRS